MTSAQPQFAPGARVVIRDCEWIIRRADPSTDGGYILTVDGISELVNGKSAQFLTKLEIEGIQVLDPVDTTLEQDLSPGFEKSRLFIEAQLRQITPADGQIHLGHKAAMDLVPYQLDPALQALKQSRQRILIADAVGLGKTLEAGILVTELMRRGRGKRILVLTLKSMMTQFQKEFWNRFTIPLTRLDSAGLQRIRNNIPGNHNPFYYYDKTIISIDTLKQDNEFRRHLEQAYWDIIVIDEAHNVAERSSSSQRAKLAQLISHRSDTLIMLSATPHDGRAKSFASLMNMLDPTAISDPEDYTKEDFTEKGLVIRRFKKDIKAQVEQEFKERVVTDLHIDASPAEEHAYDTLLEVPFTYSGEYHPDKQGQLIRIGLQKSLFSSPAAALKSAQERINKLAGKEVTSEDEHSEIQALESLLAAIQNIDVSQFSKYQRLIKQLKAKEFGWKKSNTDDRLVIFSERIETLRWLERQLKDDLKLTDAAITLLHGQMSDIEQQGIVEDFGKPDTKLRVLLCSDVASEGINLHYLSHRLVHFDLPWSLMVFQQRNGRIDRYGQNVDPQILYMIIRSQNETVRGDQRILEVLKEKDQQAYENIGDPSVFMGVHDTEAEMKLTEKAMAEGLTAETFDQTYQPDTENEGDDLVALFLNPEAATPGSSNKAALQLTDGYSLFESDLEFAEQALQALNRNRKRADYSYVPGQQLLNITAPDDLQYRFRQLPPEIRPENWHFNLTTDKQAFDQEVRRSREDETAWPKLHFLWPQHPVIEWLESSILAEVARHSAPVLALGDGLQPGESVFLVSGLIPNRKSHPVIWEWFVVRCKEGEVVELEAAIDWLKALDLRKTRPNRAAPIDLQHLDALKPAAIEAVERAMRQRQSSWQAEQEPRLAAQLAMLQELRGKQEQQLELSLQNSNELAGKLNSRRERRMAQIDTAFKSYTTWVQDTMTIEPNPWMQIIAAFTADGAK